MFLSRYHISSVEDLATLCDHLEDKRKEISRERSRCYKERAVFQPLFEIAQQMEKLSPAESSFQKGDDYFEEEHQRYAQL